MHPVRRGRDLGVADEYGNELNPNATKPCVIVPEAYPPCVIGGMRPRLHWIAFDARMTT